MYICYDSTTPEVIPKDAQVVAGYAGGSWHTYPYIQANFPHAYRIEIAVNAGEKGHCLDVENGDATPDEAPGWIKEMEAEGIHRPMLYASAWTWGQIIPLLTKARVGRFHYRRWVAAPNGLKIAAQWLAAGYDACQFDWHYLGLNLDASLCLPSFLDGGHHTPAPLPLPPILPPPH